MTEIQPAQPLETLAGLTNQFYLGKVLEKTTKGKCLLLIGDIDSQHTKNKFKIYGRFLVEPEAGLEKDSVWRFRLQPERPIANRYRPGIGLGFAIDVGTMEPVFSDFVVNQVKISNREWINLAEKLMQKPVLSEPTAVQKIAEPKKNESQSNDRLINGQLLELQEQLKDLQALLGTKDAFQQRLEEQLKDSTQQVAHLDVSLSNLLIEKRALEQESAVQRAIIEEARTLGFAGLAGKKLGEIDDASQLSLLEQLDLRLIEKKAFELGMNLTSDEIRRIVVAYLIAGATGQQVLFAGPPGSGKSTASVQFPNWLGMNVSVIPVRPGWLDSSDLIGYFDSRAGHFEQGPFVDEVIRAQQILSQQRFHVVVLDEMNIARIENYAADVLSQLEKAHQLNVESESGIRLYSPETYERLRLIEIAKKGGVDVETEHRILPAKLPIPKNLIVSGTLNHDRTTHAISPKVKDRSLFIKFESHGIELGVEPVVGADDNFAIPFTLFDRKKGKALNQDSPLIGKWNSLRAAILKSGVWNIQPSFRVAEAVRLLPALAEFLDVEVEILFEDLLLMKLAPWIDFENDATNRKQVQDFSSQISELGFSNLSSQLNSVLQTTAGRFSFL